MKTEDLIEALDQRYGNPLAKGYELIHEAIKQLKFYSEGNVAFTKETNNGD